MGAERKRVTLLDVARETGVSAKTVSNVVNNKGNVSEAVRAEILQTIKRLDYRPNLAARHLRQGSSRMIALTVPTLREPYFAELASSFVTCAQKMNVLVLVTETGGERGREKLAIEGHNLPGIDAIICSPLALTEADLRSRNSTLPLVLLGEYASEFSGHGYNLQIGFNNIEAARVATEHLLKQGAQKIVVLGHQEDRTQATSRLRFQGYEEALADAGIPLDPNLIGTVIDFNRGEAARALQRIIDSNTYFDGILCFSDTLALGALPVLASNDSTRYRSIPIVGFDNIEEAQFVTPPFDTIDPHMGSIASTALNQLFGPASSLEEGRQKHVVTEFELITRR